jgi:hypothetical protein
VSARTLEAVLRASGIHCSVEAMDRLAVIIPEDGEAGLAMVHGRREALRMIGAHGFTHMALELPGEPADGAPLHRD